MARAGLEPARAVMLRRRPRTRAAGAKSELSVARARAALALTGLVSNKFTSYPAIRAVERWLIGRRTKEALAAKKPSGVRLGSPPTALQKVV
jgi:hypothetical protein